MDNTDFKLPLYKSLLQPELFAGIPKNIAYMILALVCILFYIFGKWSLLVIPVIYVPCRIIAAYDPLLLTVSMNCLTEPEFLEA